MWFKLCKFCENRARDTPLRGVYIPDFGQIWVKISILGVLHPWRCTDGGEIWHDIAIFVLKRDVKLQLTNVSPLRGEKPQNWPLSKLNTGRFALRAMLPVKTPEWPVIRTSLTKTDISCNCFSMHNTFLTIFGYLWDSNLLTIVSMASKQSQKTYTHSIGF